MVIDEKLQKQDYLRNFYVKALEKNELKVEERTGLEKTLQRKYAFFVSETIAKRILNNELMFKRCSVSELQISNARGTLALPIPLNSPYKRIINTRYIFTLWLGSNCWLRAFFQRQV